MSKKTKKASAKLALRRLAEDEQVQGQLRTAAVRVREAATALTKAGNRLSRPPEPPKHHGRKAALVAIGAGGAAYALRKRRGRLTGNGAAATDPAGAEVKNRETTPVSADMQSRSG